MNPAAQIRRAARPCIAAAIVVLAAPLGVCAEAKRISEQGKAEAVKAAAALLKGNYVFPELGEKAGAFIQAQLRKGAYRDAADRAQFAAVVAKDLRDVTHDLHMNFTVMPDRPGQASDAEDERMRQYFLHEGARRNFFFEKAERLPGNVGYLEFRQFVPVEYGGPTAIAAMNFLAHSDAIIIDLRRNGGGYVDMVQLLATYFFKEPTHLNDLFWRKGDAIGLFDTSGSRRNDPDGRGGDRTAQYWTLPTVPGERMVGTPLYILTSAHTVSAAEDFTYSLKELGRAKIVGETTAGGANPFDVFPLNDDLVVWIPIGRAINSVSHDNWEGKGVEPDVKVPAADALAAAYLDALKGIEARSQDAKAKQEAAWAEAEAEAQLRPVDVAPEDLRRLAGDYGERKVVFERGRLYVQAGAGPRAGLTPMTRDTFAIDHEDARRIRFVSEGAGRLVELFPGGREAAFARR